MEEYAADVAAGMKTDAKSTAKNAVKELKATSPEGAGSRKGHYKDGWTSKTESESANAINIKVYNKTKPGLTHLLENGHVKRGGGRTRAIPHIAPVEQQTVEEYERRLKERLQR